MKYRRIRGDMIQLLFNVDSISITRRHKFKLQKPFVKSKVPKHLCSIQVINDWNSLLPSVSITVQLDSFEMKLPNKKYKL